MKITRHNYETFFLLYIDNELSSAEKKVVEEFVDANPDLQEEFVMFQQSVLKADDIIFDKETLFKKESGVSDLEEKLLLRIDNELSMSENAALAAFIHSDSNIEKEWDVLQQTRLVADPSVVFPDKNLLYRREKGKLAAFPWMKFATAAVFLGFVIWGGITYVSSVKPENNNQVVKNPDQISPVKPLLTQPSKKENIKPTPVDVVVDDKTIHQKPIAPKSAEVLQKHTKKSNNKLVPEKEDIALKSATNNLPEPYLDNINKAQRNKNNPPTVTSLKKATNMDDPGNHVIEDSQEQVAESVNSFATTASLADNTEEINDNRILFMDEDKVKKTKLGGIFRKVKRVFDRNANVKEGSNKIRVANLEFAIQ